MSAFLSSVFGAGAQLFTNTGIVLSGGKIATYVAGSTTPQATWTDSTQAVQNANPIILDSAGRTSNEIWLANGAAYKFVVSDSNNNVIGTYDNIPAINQTNFAVSQWTTSGLVPTYVNSTTFTVPGDQTAQLQSNRRIQFNLNSGTFYGYISSAAYDGTTQTTVVIVPDSTSLDNTISTFNYGLISATNTSIPQQFIISAGDKVPSRSSLTTNAFLSNDGTNSDWVNISVVIQSFTSSGTYTPTAGMFYCVAEMVGGGAGGTTQSSGNFGGAGGGAGEYAIGTFTAASIGASKTVTIGAAGSASTSGGTTSLSTLLTAVGGTAAASGINGNLGGAGGTGGTGAGFHCPGGQGSNGSGAFSGPQVFGGDGGASFFGGGGRGGTGSIDNGQLGSAYGSGGGGNGNSSSTWGVAAAGKAGCIVVYEYVRTAL